MRNIIITALFAARIASAETLPERESSWREDQRVAQVNGVSAGVFDACTNESTGEVLLAEAFFLAIRIKRDGDTRSDVCPGQAYAKPLGRLVSVTNRGLLLISVDQQDFEQVAAKPLAEASGFALANGEPVSLASANIHLWSNNRGEDYRRFGLALDARIYSPAALLSMTGQIDSTGLKRISEINLKRDVSKYDIDLTIGRLFGDYLYSGSMDGVRISNRSGALNYRRKSIKGFMPTPGHVQLWLRGSKIYDSEVSPGYYDIEVPPDLNGLSAGETIEVRQVSLSGDTLAVSSIDASGRTDLMPAGAAAWDFSIGEISPAGAQNFAGTSAGSKRIASGGGRYGLTDALTIDSRLTFKGNGGSLRSQLSYEFSSRLSGMLAMQFDRSGKRSLESYYGQMIHVSNKITTLISHSNSPCFGAVITNYDSQAGRCNRSSIQSSISSGNWGALTLRWEAARSYAGVTNSGGLSWSRQMQSGFNVFFSLNSASFDRSQGNSLYFGLSKSFGSMNGSYQKSVQSEGAANDSLTVTGVGPQSLSYSAALSKDNLTKDSLSARLNLSSNQPSGSAQVYLAKDQRGSSQYGASFLASIVASPAGVQVGPLSSDGYAVLQYEGLPAGQMIYESGRKLAETNADGVAVFPTSAGKTLRIEHRVDDDSSMYTGLPLEIKVGSDRWHARRWLGKVKLANRGWVRLTDNFGSPLPLGSIFNLENGQVVAVLDNGEAYFDDLPLDSKDLELVLPSRSSRCLVELAGKVPTLSTSDTSPIELICRHIK